MLELKPNLACRFHVRSSISQPILVAIEILLPWQQSYTRIQESRSVAIETILKLQIAPPPPKENALCFYKTYIPSLIMIDAKTILLSAEVILTINLSDLFSLQSNFFPVTRVKWCLRSQIQLRNYTTFKRAVHPCNSQNKRLLLDQCHLKFGSNVSTLVSILLVWEVYWEGKRLVESFHFQNRWGAQLSCKKY